MYQAAQNYQRQEVLNASPEELIVKLYDLSIQACYQQRAERLDQVLATLQQSLNFEHEPADKLYALYDYCRRKAREDHEEAFAEVRNLLEDLRKTWQEHVVPQKKQVERPRKRKGFVV